MNGDSVKTRNTEIDFYRVLMALVIVFVHSHGLKPVDTARYPFVGGYLAVEFFFILSGYFAAEKAVNHPEAGYKSALSWTWKKYRNIYPYVILTVTIHYLANAYLAGMGLFGTVKSLLYGIFEMLLLPATGLYESFLVLPLWYLSAMLILLPLFFSCVLKGKDFFLYTLCPVLVLLIYGYYSVTTQHIDRWADYNGLLFMSLPRTWAGLCLGGLVHCATKRLRSISFTKAGANVLSCIELVCLGIVIFYMYTRGYRRLDFLCIGLLAVFACIILSEKASIHKIFPLLFSKISEFSLALYVSHWTIRLLVPSLLMPNAPYEARLLPYVGLSILYAVGLNAVCLAVRRLHLAERFKRLMVQ